MMLQLVLNSGDNVKYWQSENGLLFLRCFLRFVPSGEGSFLLVVTLGNE